jgi:hypothetical protein
VKIALMCDSVEMLANRLRQLPGVLCETRQLTQPVRQASAGIQQSTGR